MAAPEPYFGPGRQSLQAQLLHIEVDLVDMSNRFGQVSGGRVVLKGWIGDLASYLNNCAWDAEYSREIFFNRPHEFFSLYYIC